MSVVQEVVERLGVPELSRNMGAALLGCTAPDRRVMTRQPRQETHFFELETDGIGDGLKGLQHAHPEVAADPRSLSWSTRALMVGYVSHLAADEAWIVDVYRPYFENEDYLGADPARNILDRALQYDLEREILEDQDRLTPWRVELGSGPPDGVPHGFIPEDVLTEWHEFVVNRVLAREGGWGEFPRFVARFRDDPGLNDHEVERFLAHPQFMFRRVYEKVPRDTLKRHRRHAVDASIEMAQVFLA